MRRLTFIGYQTNFEVPFETYFITDNNLASRKVRCAQFIVLCNRPFCLTGNIRDRSRHRITQPKKLQGGKIQAAKVSLIACSILCILGITASSSVGAKGTGTPGFPRRTGGAFKC